MNPDVAKIITENWFALSAAFTGFAVIASIALRAKGRGADYFRPGPNGLKTYRGDAKNLTPRHMPDVARRSK